VSIPDFQYGFPSVIFKKPETGGILGAVIEGLPDKQCLVVSLYYYGGLNMASIRKTPAVYESREIR